jgi:flavin reductase (DIM6/NTAB) family NADH-FMN oxidoreductase RutF
VTALDAMTSAVDYPVYVVTTLDPSSGEPAGCLVGFATQCSIDPMRFLVCLSKANRTFRVAAEADVLVVHMLGSAQCDLAELFGSRTGDEVDKFSRCTWREGPGGAPVLDAVAAWFAGRVLDRVDVGDHVGFVVEPFEEGDHGEGPFLTFQAVRRLEPGHPA